jgi:hypothetical protein
MEVLEGAVPEDLFELYSVSTGLEHFTALIPEHKENATTFYEWLQASVGQRPANVGRFWFSNTLPRSRWEQLNVIEEFYTDDRIENQLLPLIHKSNSAVTTGKRVSLRVLDWLVTNFSKKNRIIYTLHLENGTTVPFNLYLQYKASLNRYKRHVFDPFRRHKRVYFVFKHHMFSTTVGQLNFMHWAFKHNIITYAQSRMAEIEADMTQCIKENQKDKEHFKKRGKKRCRKPLCKIVPRKCFVYSIDENVVFVQCPPKKK